ncbi:MAG TPA: hypothetical protein VNK73_00865 [Actinomycetota bacterium]|nr:hypothetical protein [Actinomycetota bacterium]
MGQPSPERALVVVAPAAPPAELVVAAALRRATRLALGAAGLALDAVQALLERSVPADPVAGAAAQPSVLPQTVRLLPGAVIGVGMEVQRRSLRAAVALGGALGPPLSVAVHPVVAHGPLAAVRRRLDLERWNERGRAEQQRNELAAAAFARSLVAGVVAAVLDEVDLDAVVARVDLDQVVDRLDLDRVVERLDLDAIVARVDVDAILRQVDFAAVTERVMDEVDVAEIIRESSSTMASETADALRVQGMQADRALGRLVDRALRRKGERQTALGAAPTAGDDR